MSTDAASLEEIGALQLSDSFFPTGMYTTSSGLEALFYSKKMKNANELRDLIRVYLEHQIGPADCAALGSSFDSIKRRDLNKLIEVDRMIVSMKLIEEIRNASTRSGTQLLKCLNSFIKEDPLLNKYQEAIKNKEASGVYPVSLALASNLFEISKVKAGIIMLYGFTVSMIGASLRLGMLQHFDGQRIIHELKPYILDAVKKNIDRPLSSMWQFAPGIDLIQIAHEQMSSKMFIT
jgi:urease accessory protein